jgi:hypothetical protein
MARACSCSLLVRGFECLIVSAVDRPHGMQSLLPEVRNLAEFSDGGFGIRNGREHLGAFEISPGFDFHHDVFDYEVEVGVAKGVAILLTVMGASRPISKL